MMNQQHPEFKPGFRYQNIGNIVGTLNYARELKRKDGSVFGWEFLINARGFGSVNVRIPIMDRAQNSIDNYPVSEKPRVRARLTRIEQFTSNKGKTYTSATTFMELSDATTVTGEEMKDNIAGRIAGEIYNIQQIQGENGPALKFNIVTFLKFGGGITPLLGIMLLTETKSLTLPVVTKHALCFFKIR